VSPCALPRSNLKFLPSLFSLKIIQASLLVHNSFTQLIKVSPKLKNLRDCSVKLWLILSKAFFMSREIIMPLLSSFFADDISVMRPISTS
jgi:hypothetical protein